MNPLPHLRVGGSEGEVVPVDSGDRRRQQAHVLERHGRGPAPAVVADAAGRGQVEEAGLMTQQGLILGLEWDSALLRRARQALQPVK